MLVLSKSKIVDSTYKLVSIKIHRTAVVFLAGNRCTKNF